MAHDIFISYRRDDELLALSVVMPMIAAGYDVWWDKSFYKKRERGMFPDFIERQARGCKDFILIVTNNTFANIDSEKSWIRKELRFALSGDVATNNKPHIIPLYVDKANIPLKLPNDINGLLENIDFSPLPLDEIMESYGQSATFTHKSLYKIFNDKLGFDSTPSFERAGKSQRGSTYDASSNEESERLHIQAENTKSFDMQYINEIIAEHPEGGLTVLDLGCNNGEITRSRFEDDCFKFVVGVDCKDACIEEAKKSIRVDKQLRKKFKFIKLSIDDSDFDTKLEDLLSEYDIELFDDEMTFDVIFAAQVLHFIDNSKYEQCLTKLRGLLKPGGKIIIRESDDGTKICYGSDGCESTLKKVLDMTDSLKKVADRHMGRKLYRLLDNCGFDSIELHSFQRDTSNMTEKEKIALFRETFPWRLSAVLDENSKKSETYRIMEECIKRLETCFRKRDFWYSEYEYICKGTRN